MGLAALADSVAEDLALEDGLDEQLELCATMLSHSIELDRDSQTERLESLLTRAQVPLRPLGPDALQITLKLLDSEAPCVVRLQDVGISFVVHLGDARPTGPQTLRELLRLNRAVDVAKCGIDGYGDLAMLYEVPSLHDDIVEHLTSQFTALLIGIVKAIRG